jgi:hypothetical protein
MANCFDNLIGIKSGCEPIVGSSSFYVEDIGITEQECDMYINSEYSNGSQLIKDKLSFVSELVKKTISNHFAEYIITKNIIDSSNLGDYQDSLNYKSGIANTLGGINIALVNNISYFQVYVNSISLQVNVTQAIDVFVYDLISGSLIDTIVIDAVANEISTTYVNKTYQSPKRKLDLIFVYNTDGINSNNTLLDYAGCTTCNGYRYSNSYINSQAIYLSDSVTPIRSSLVGNTHTFGMSVNYSVQCSMDNWLCEITNLLALPILYKLGEEIMNYSVYYSNRQNSKTNIDYERNKERLAMYKEYYNDALNSSIKKINIPKGDTCFVCNDVFKSTIVLP